MDLVKRIEEYIDSGKADYDGILFSCWKELRELRKENDRLRLEKSWRNPYTEAIGLLESAARSHEGSYG